MKKTLRIILPILLSVAIIACTVWYLFIYDRGFTRDVLLNMARQSEDQGNHNAAAWLYNVAYAQLGNNDAVAIELANQYKSNGNYTKAEYTLSKAISDGGGIELYIALCNTYIEQDKLLDAVTMLDSISNPNIKKQIDSLRPSTPSIMPDPGFYSQYISATLTCTDGDVYVSASGEYPSINTVPCSSPITLSDGENTIYAVSVSDDGLVSPLSIYGYTIGGVVKELQFSDNAIESSIRTMLNISTEQQMFTNDLWSIKDYEIPAGAKDFSDLKHMSFLEKLTVSKGKSSDFSFLPSLVNLTELVIRDTDVSKEALSTISALPALKKLTLSNCSLSSLSTLSKCTGLIYLDISNNTIRNIDALAALTNLQELYMQHNAVIDLSAITGLSQLTKLDISHNALTSLSPIRTLTALTWLNASVNSITEVNQLGNLTKLIYLDIGSNQISDISPLSSCIAIADLNISSNAITDIQKISSLTNMEHFDFSYNQVSALPSFQKDCPLVTINGSNNLITSLENLGGLLNLNIVYMDYNPKLSSVKALSTCPVLVQVNIYGTKVKDVKALTQQSIIVNYQPV